jgi:hypothetical protein
MSAEDALAAVIAQVPRLAAYRLVAPTVAVATPPGSPRLGPTRGQRRAVLAQRIADGMRLIFMTDSGDCASGCTIQHDEVYLVHSDGTVVLACVADAIPVGIDDPCRPG